MCKKIFQRALMVLLAVTLLFTATAYAEVQTYEGVGEYPMTNETMDFAKEEAEKYAMRDILEQISVYIDSVSKVDNAVLQRDEVIAISAGILHVVNSKFSCETKEDCINVKAFVTAEIDIDELEYLLEQAVKDYGRR